MSKIEWTERTWNPVTGCTVTSPGCKNCYAMGMARRLEAMTAKTGAMPQYEGVTKMVNGRPVWTGKIGVAGDKIWEEPMRRKKPALYFVNSMGDLFHPNVPDDLIDRAFAVMALSAQHTFQILTKHSGRMRAYFQKPIKRSCGIIENHVTDMMDCRYPLSVQGAGQKLCAQAGEASILPLPNVWLGVSVENQAAAQARIPDLLATPAAIRFISAEPLLGPVNLNRRWHDQDLPAWSDKIKFDNWLTGETLLLGTAGSKVISKGVGLDWVIVGGESGRGARPMHPDFARSLRDQCAAASTAFFFKQWGRYVPYSPQEAGSDYESSDGAVHWDNPKFYVKTTIGFSPISESETHVFAQSDNQIYRRVNKNADPKTLDGVPHQEMPSA